MRNHFLKLVIPYLDCRLHVRFLPNFSIILMVKQTETQMQRMASELILCVWVTIDNKKTLTQMLMMTQTQTLRERTFGSEINLPWQKWPGPPCFPPLPWWQGIPTHSCRLGWFSEPRIHQRPRAMRKYLVRCLENRDKICPNLLKAWTLSTRVGSHMLPLFSEQFNTAWDYHHLPN